MSELNEWEHILRINIMAGWGHCDEVVSVSTQCSQCPNSWLHLVADIVHSAGEHYIGTSEWMRDFRHSNDSCARVDPKTMAIQSQGISFRRWLPITTLHKWLRKIAYSTADDEIRVTHLTKDLSCMHTLTY